jgi:hypothetical protein
VKVSSTPGVSLTLPWFIREFFSFFYVCTAWRWGWCYCKRGISLAYHIAYCTYCTFIRGLVHRAESGFDPNLIRMRFVVHTEASGQDFLRNPLFSCQLFHQRNKIIPFHLPSTLCRLEQCFSTGVPRPNNEPRAFTKCEARFFSRINIQMTL